MATRNTFFALLVGLTFLFGDSGQAAELSMEGSVQAALMGNRDLVAARYAVATAKGRLLQAGLLPNPDFELSGMSDFAFGAQGEGAFTLGLSQRFPITARLSLERQVRRVEVAQAVREIRNQERLLIARVQSLYVQVQAARGREKAADRARESAADLVTLTAKRIQVGQGSLADSGLTKLEERSWANASASARVEAETQLLELKSALGIPAAAPLALSESLESILTRLRRIVPPRGPIHRPDADVALLEIDRAAADLRLARAEEWEGIRLGVEYTYDDALDEPSGLGTSQFLGLRVSIPLPVWDQKKGTVAERQAIEEQAAATVRAIELEIANAIAIAARKADLLAHQLNRYLADTEGVVAASEKELALGFEQGRVDLRDLLQVRARSETLRVDAVALREQLALALISLQAAAATHPEISKPYLETSDARDKASPKKPTQ
jgi:cobalt-zinc-cadmium efflux system outer membrane protein